MGEGRGGHHCSLPAFLFLVPPTHEDPINKSEENARLEVNQPAPPGEVWAVAVVSRTSIWRSINLAVLSPSILALAGFVCAGDKRRRHPFPDFLPPLATKGRTAGMIYIGSSSPSFYMKPSAVSCPSELRKCPGSLLLEEGRRGVPGVCSKMPGRGAVGVLTGSPLTSSVTLGKLLPLSVLQIFSTVKQA